MWIQKEGYMVTSKIIEEIVSRRACRALSEKAVDKEIILRLLEAATLAPSCNNKQPWRFLVADKEASLEKAREALTEGNYWANVAPVLVVVTTRDEFDSQLSDNRNYAQFDTGMAVMNLMLQATREGLYAHPLAGFDPFVIRKNFAIEEATQIITLLAIGFPGDGLNLNEKHAELERSARVRKNIDDIVQWNDWVSLD